MNLLLSRNQAPGLRRTTFSVWAKADLLPDEAALVSKYSEIRSAVLIDGDPRTGLGRAAFFAAPVAVIAAVMSWTYGAGVWLTALVFLCAFGMVAHLIYEQLREQVFVRDLLDGRTFKCKSIVALMKREDNIKLLAVDLRQVLEDMKTWGGKEVMEIQPRRVQPTPEVVTHGVEHYRERPLSAVS